MQFVVLIPVLGVGASLSSDRDLASGLPFKIFLGCASWTQNQANVIGFRGIDGIGEVNFLRFFQRLVIVGRDKVLVDFHALLNETALNALVVLLPPHISGVDSFAVLIVDGFGGGRPEVGVVHLEIDRLLQFLIDVVEAVQADDILQVIHTQFGRDAIQ